ncbi:MAG: acyltransferase domain-containing protein [Acidimicrobiales bacterium]
MELAAAEELSERLGLDAADRYWVAGLDAAGAPFCGVRIPDAVESAATLARIGVAEADAADVIATLPSPVRDPEWWWLLERSVHKIVSEMGEPDKLHVGWPDWTAATPGRPLGQRCFMAHVYLATLPYLGAWHVAHGIPEEVSLASFADLARHMAIHRRVFGEAGVDASWWLTLSLRGEAFDLGRLQFTYFRLGHGDQAVWWYPPEAAAALGSGFLHGDSCIGVHIPEGRPMTPEACDESFALAAAFMQRYFPPPAGQQRRVATCWSWLLDDQLADILPASSNIVRFQRRFELVPGWVPGDESVAEFVWRRQLPSQGPTPEWLDTLPQNTRLERALVAHLRDGGHFRVRSGWLDL